MSDSYRLSDRKPGAPCSPGAHNFTTNGKCWRCNHYRDDLLRDAQQLLEIHKGAKPKPKPVGDPRDASKVVLECCGCGEQHDLANFYIDGFYHVFGMQDFPRWIHDHAHHSRNLARPSNWRPDLGLHLTENRGFEKAPFKVILV